MKKIIFPNVDIGENRDNMVFHTNMRLLHEGKYYLVEFNMQSGGTTSEEAKKSMIKHFFQEAYFQLVLKRVDLSAVDHLGNPVFIEDPDQTPEVERVKKSLNQWLKKEF